MPVDPLTADEARALAAALLGDGPTAQADLIARESDGNPLLLHELVRFFRTGTAADGLTLDTVLRARADRLADEPRRLLDVIAVAAGPDRPGHGRPGRRPAPRPPAGGTRRTARRQVRAGPAGRRRPAGGGVPRPHPGGGGRRAGGRRAGPTTTGGWPSPTRRPGTPGRRCWRTTSPAPATRPGRPRTTPPRRSRRPPCWPSTGRPTTTGRRSPDCRPTTRAVGSGWSPWARRLAGAGRGREAADAFTARRRPGPPGRRPVLPAAGGRTTRPLRPATTRGWRRCSGVFGRPGSPCRRRRRPWPGRSCGCGFGRGCAGTGSANGRRSRFPRTTDCGSTCSAGRPKSSAWSDHLPGTWLHYRGLRLSLRAGDPYAVAVSLARETTIGLPFRPPSPARIERVQARARAVAAPGGRPGPAGGGAWPSSRCTGRSANLLVGDFRRALAEFGPAYEAIDRCAGVERGVPAVGGPGVRGPGPAVSGRPAAAAGSVRRRVPRTGRTGEPPRGGGPARWCRGPTSSNLPPTGRRRPAAMIRGGDRPVGPDRVRPAGAVRLVGGDATCSCTRAGRPRRGSTARRAWGRANWRSLLSVAMAALLADWARARAAVARAAELDGTKPPRSGERRTGWPGGSSGSAGSRSPRRTAG